MRLGRPNKGVDHVERLEASAGPRERLRAILETITGERTVADACAVLGVSHTRFKQLRQQALQGAVDALQPGRPGRPRTRNAAADQRVAALRAELEEVHRARERDRVRAHLAVAVPDVLARSEKRGDRPSRRAVRR